VAPSPTLPQDVFARLPAASQEKFLKALFDPVEGNGYTLCRTTIHSSDYSAGMYTYDDVAGDTELKQFSIDPHRRNAAPHQARPGGGEGPAQAVRLALEPRPRG